MNHLQIEQLLAVYHRVFHQKGEVISALYGVEPKEYANGGPASFIQGLTEAGYKHQVIFLQNDLPSQDLVGFLTGFSFLCCSLGRKMVRWIS